MDKDYLNLIHTRINKDSFTLDELRCFVLSCTDLFKNLSENYLYQQIQDIGLLAPEFRGSYYSELYHNLRKSGLIKEDEISCHDGGTWEESQCCDNIVKGLILLLVGDSLDSSMIEAAKFVLLNCFNYLYLQENKYLIDKLTLSIYQKKLP